MTISSAALRIAVLSACVALFPAQAHHSYAAFDRCKPTTLDGEIVGVEWANPHVVINVRTVDVANYRVEWLSLVQLENRGVAHTLQAGDHVVILGHAMRDPNLKVLSLLSEIRRPSDDWVWTIPVRPAPERCAAG